MSLKTPAADTTRTVEKQPRLTEDQIVALLAIKSLAIKWLKISGAIILIGACIAAICALVQLCIHVAEKFAWGKTVLGLAIGVIVGTFALYVNITEHILPAYRSEVKAIRFARNNPKE